MKKETYVYPHSSFLSVEKDMSIICNMIMKNKNLQKLLYYTSKDCLSQKDLTQKQILDMFGKNVKIVPKLQVNNQVLNYVIVTFDNFATSGNPEFRDNIIEFDIVCQFDQWHLKDFQLRPFKIAAEIDSMFNNKRLTGIGKIEFLGANLLPLTEDYGGICLLYTTVHGEEDKKNIPNPEDEEQFLDNFNEMFNK